MSTKIDIDNLTVRLAGYGDARPLLRLAALDSARVPDGPLVVAEHRGELLAAVPLAGGTVIADPFRRTAGVVELLELRAAQLRAQAEPSRWAPAKRVAAALRPV